MRNMIVNIFNKLQYQSKLFWLYCLGITLVILTFLLIIIGLLISIFHPYIGIKLIFNGLTSIGTLGVALFSILMVFLEEEKNNYEKLKQQCQNINGLILPKINDLIIHFKRGYDLVNNDE